jgi:mono/diheme cytochrome c family protein
MKRTTVLMIIVGAMFAGASFTTVGAQQSRTANDRIYAADQASRGATLYADTCAACHDPKLLGGIGPALAGKDFISAWKDKSVADVFTKIKVEMPLTAPGTLTADQTADVLSFILRENQFPAGTAPLATDAAPLKDIHISEPAGGAAAGSPSASSASSASGAGAAGAAAGGGLFADVQAKRGESVYTDNCTACHGATLGGDIGPALSGPRFAARWKDKGVAVLFEKIKTTMPASAPGSLTPEQTADVVAFILSTNHYPGGATELTADAAPQKKTPLGDPPQK